LSYTLFTNKMKSPPILRKAEIIDTQLFNKLQELGRKRVPADIITSVVKNIFPNSKYLGKGVSKLAFQITFGGRRNFVLKVVKDAAKMASYTKPYEISGKSQKARNHSYLKHYWATQFCILQKYAEEVDESNPEQMKQVLKLKRKFKTKLYDLKVSNLGVENGKVKILDACIPGRYKKLHELNPI
jgi:hypothetical protein